MNQTVLDYLGYTREEYIGKPITNFCPTFNDLVLDVLQTKGCGSTLRDVNITTFKTKRRGENRDDLLIDSNNVNCNYDGSFKHTLCVTRYDTSRTKREEYLKTSDELQDRLLRENNRFVSKFIHEINKDTTPHYQNVVRSK